jgi:hypothetical protein
MRKSISAPAAANSGPLHSLLFPGHGNPPMNHRGTIIARRSLIRGASIAGRGDRLAQVRGKVPVRFPEGVATSTPGKNGLRLHVGRGIGQQRRR